MLDAIKIRPFCILFFHPHHDKLYYLSSEKQRLLRDGLMEAQEIMDEGAITY